MGWRDLLAKEDETVVLPWVGGRLLRSTTRSWALDKLPVEYGWYSFGLAGRAAVARMLVEPQPEQLGWSVKGYLVGDRLVPDNTKVDPDPRRIVEFSECVHLLEVGLDRFVRVEAGRIYEGGPLVYKQQEMQLGPEDVVLEAFLDQHHSVADVKDVTPALDAAFRMETWQRAEADRRRQELERLRQEEAERQAREERRRRLLGQLGDGASRRELAVIDFGAAAKAALAVGGAELLDHRLGQRRGEHVVRYRLDGRRFEAVCDDNLRICSAGICLTSHETGEKGDTRFSLESLPAVVRQADREGVLVVLRHV
jgi:hypothetical protein